MENSTHVRVYRGNNVCTAGSIMYCAKPYSAIGKIRHGKQTYCIPDLKRTMFCYTHVLTANLYDV